MDIFQRLKKLVVFLYITAKWLGFIIWWVLISSMVWAEGWSILLVYDRAGHLTIGVIFAIFLFVPLIILSAVEWVLFGKFTWSYKSFENSMVKKEHVKIITSKLKSLGSDVPKDISIDKAHALANILYLATGNGTHKLSIEQINQINGDDFIIKWE